MSEHPDERTFSELISGGLDQLTALFRSEVQLAKVEMTKKVSSASIAIGLMATGFIVSIATLVMLLTTVATGLIHAGFGPTLSFLIATIIGAAVTAILLWSGLQKLRSETIAPERTLRQVQRDAQAAKGSAT